LIKSEAGETGRELGGEGHVEKKQILQAERRKQGKLFAEKRSHNCKRKDAKNGKGGGEERLLPQVGGIVGGGKVLMRGEGVVCFFRNKGVEVLKETNTRAEKKESDVACQARTNNE